MATAIPLTFHWDVNSSGKEEILKTEQFMLELSMQAIKLADRSVIPVSLMFCQPLKNANIKKINT
jgi:hypothetical protein